MRSRRFVVVAVAALFVALVLVAAPHSVSLRSQSVGDFPAASYTVTAADAPPVPIAVSPEQVKRAFSFDAVFAFLAIALAIAPALLFGVGSDAPAGSFRPSTGRRYRGRAPPFARA